MRAFPGRQGSIRLFHGAVVSIDILQNDNRGIHNHADGDDETRQSHHVQRVRTEPEHHQARQKRQWDTHGNHNRRPHIRQEDENDQNRENDSLYQRGAHATDVQVDERLLIVGDFELDVGVLRLELGQEALEGLDSTDRRAVVRPQNVDRDGGLAVTMIDAPLLGLPQAHLRHVGDTQQALIGVANRQVANLLEIGELARGLDEVLVLGTVDRSRRRRDVLPGQSGCHLADRQAVGSQAVAVHVDLHLRLVTAEDVHVGNAR